MELKIDNDFFASSDKICVWVKFDPKDPGYCSFTSYELNGRFDLYVGAIRMHVFKAVSIIYTNFTGFVKSSKEICFSLRNFNMLSNKPW